MNMIPEYDSRPSHEFDPPCDCKRCCYFWSSGFDDFDPVIWEENWQKEKLLSKLWGIESIPRKLKEEITQRILNTEIIKGEK